MSSSITEIATNWISTIEKLLCLMSLANDEVMGLSESSVLGLELKPPHWKQHYIFGPLLELPGAKYYWEWPQAHRALFGCHTL